MGVYFMNMIDGVIERVFAQRTPQNHDISLPFLYARI